MLDAAVKLEVNGLGNAWLGNARCGPLQCFWMLLSGFVELLVQLFDL